MDMHTLAETIARELLARLRPEEARPWVMVLGAQDERTVAMVRESLREEPESGADLRFSGEDAGGRAPCRYILPRLSCVDMADLAAGRATGDTAAQALRLLLSGHAVEVLEFEYRVHAETAPAALYALYESHERTLVSFGLREFRRRPPEAIRLRQRVITAEDVAGAAKSGASALLVSPGAKITPLARESAANLNIRIAAQP